MSILNCKRTWQNLVQSQQNFGFCTEASGSPKETEFNCRKLESNGETAIVLSSRFWYRTENSFIKAFFIAFSVLQALHSAD